jgi:hypothetical protein
MRRALPIATGFALLLLCGVVHGLWTGRWQDSQLLEAAAARVEDVPLAFGNWKGKALPVDLDEFAQAGARGYWMRLYTNRQTGVNATALLMCGRWGKMSVHTPDLCYRGVGYEILGEAVRLPVRVPGEAPIEFWTARFRKQGLAGTRYLRIAWAWSDGGPWRAPTSPRWTFAGSPFLYKLYVVRDVTAEAESLEIDQTLEFLNAFHPELRKALFAPMPPGRTS